MALTYLAIFYDEVGDAYWLLLLSFALSIGLSIIRLRDSQS